MKKLLVVESPAKIKTISKFLGKDFKIMSTVGHVRDLPTKQLGVTIDKDHIVIEYVTIEGKEKTIAELCKEASKSDEIYLAPDPDREGEIIAWHVEQEMKKVIKDPSIIHRITFNEITKPAITQAIEHPAQVDLQKVAAQQARRVLDRWVGYEVSPILWRKITKGLSAGRVQSVALKLICDREEEIRAFKPEEYWSIEADFMVNGSKIHAPLTHISKKKAEIHTEKEAQAIIKQLPDQSFSIESIQDKQRLKNPLAPFMTSTLQQAAYNRLGFSVKKTMQLAQNLYEGIALEDEQTPVALITYMRTDSLRISDTALKQIRSYITSSYGSDYLPAKSVLYAKASKAQDAHEAIRPVDISITPEYARKYLPNDAAQLYELIWRRAVACQMKPALYAQRQVVIQGGKFTFKVTGSTLIFDGYLRVYNTEEDEEKEDKVVIPEAIKAQDPLDLKKTFPKQHFTQPPPRFTEASLVKELEKEGIGRPSTYATILNTIRARSYTSLDQKKRFIPTELGMTVTKMLTQYLPKIMDTKFTANMEEDLDKIAHGSLERDALLKEFYQTFEKDLVAFAGQDVKRPAEPTDITCPNCGKAKLAIRIGKTGHFLGCLNFPECTFTSNFKRLEDGSIELVAQEQPKTLDQNCPECSKPLRYVNGKFGQFIACSGYPDCKYIHQIVANFPCPLDQGQVIRKLWKGGPFWGCKNYPKCKFVIFGDIEQTPCPQCKTPYLLKKYDKQGNVELMCSNKECGYKQ